MIPDECDARIARVYDYWQARRPSPGMLPGRQHIKPLELNGLLPHVWLCDVRRDPLRFRYRILGTAITMAMGKDVTGYWLDDVHESFVSSKAYADFAAAVQAKAPSLYRGRPQFHLHKDYVAIERLLLPLAENGEDVDMLLGLTVYRANFAAMERAPQPAFA
jgi:hypothetical protein